MWNSAYYSTRFVQRMNFSYAHLHKFACKSDPLWCCVAPRWPLYCVRFSVSPLAQPVHHTDPLDFSKSAESSRTSVKILQLLLDARQSNFKAPVDLRAKYKIYMPYGTHMTGYNDKSNLYAVEKIRSDPNGRCQLFSRMATDLLCSMPLFSC